MRSFLLSMAALVALASSFNPQVAWAANGQQEVSDAVTALEKWLGTGANGEKWRKYLRLEDLKAEVAKGDKANEEVVAEVYAKLDSKAAGLNLPPFERVRSAVLAWQNELALPTREELPTFVTDQKDKLTIPNQEALDKAKADLAKSLTALNRFLGTLGKVGPGWKAYLKVDDLQAQLAAAEPDLDALQEIEAKFIADKNGLELKPIYDTGNALLKYNSLLEVATSEKADEEVKKTLDDVSGDLAKYAAAPSRALAEKLGDALGWIAKFPGSEALLMGIRREFAQPNGFARMSEKFIGGGIERNFDENTPVRDNILGTSVSGTGRTVGNVDVVLVPNPLKGMFDTILTGTANTNTVGYNGPAVIRSRGTTQIAGRKRVMMDGNGYNSLPATARAVTRTQILGVSAGGRMATNVAQGRVAGSKPASEQEASRHAEARLRNRMDTESTKNLSKANASFNEKFRNPLNRLREFPEILNFATQTDAIYVTALQANDGQLGAPNAPPAWDFGTDLGSRAHETLANNIANTFYGGRIITKEEVEKNRKENADRQPDEFKDLPPDENQNDWEMELMDEKPVVITVKDNGFDVDVYVKRFRSGERTFKEKMRVSTSYKMEIFEKRPRLTREGELSVEPIDSAEKQSIGVIALKRILNTKFNRFLLPQITFQKLKLRDQWERLGPLDIVEFKSEGGWISASWVVPQAAPAAPTKTNGTERASAN